MSNIPAYTITNEQVDRSVDATDSIDLLADALATLINDEAADLALTPWTTSGTVTDRTFDANATSLGELIDCLGTLVTDAKAGTFDSADWTITNDSVDRAYDADVTSLDELADVLATFIQDGPLFVATPRVYVVGRRFF